MNHPLDDETVARLPLAAGRAELLEEIMSTPTTETDTDDPAGLAGRDRSGNARRWLVPLTVAATVAAVVAAPLWWSSRSDDGGREPDAAAGPTGSAEATGDRLVLDEPGFVLDYVSDGNEYGTSARWVDGGASLEVTGYPASTYDSYVQDRRHITDPPSDGEPVEVVGETGAMWSYNGRDHTVIRPVQDGIWYEVRGDGMSEDAYVALLGSLRLVDHATLDAMLPERFVTDAERPQAVQDILDGIAEVADPLLPEGDDAPITSVQSDPYQLGADVAGQVACRWFAVYEAAVRDGDDDAADLAVSVMSTSRQWPVLQEMDAEGDFSEVVHELSDRIAAGRSPQEYEGALGCTG